MKTLFLTIFLLISFNASSAPIGFADVEMKLKPPIERDWCLNPIGETEASIAAKGLTCLEWQPLPSNEIASYEIYYQGGEKISDVPHVVGYVDFIFADVVLPYGTHILAARAFDTDARSSTEKTFTINVVMPTGNPKSLMEFSVTQKP